MIDQERPVSDRLATTERITALSQIDYERATDLIVLRGATHRSRRHRDICAAQDHPQAITVLSRTVLGWGEHNAVVYIEPDLIDCGGYYLARIKRAAPE